MLSDRCQHRQVELRKRVVMEYVFSYPRKEPKAGDTENETNGQVKAEILFPSKPCNEKSRRPRKT